MNQKGFAPILLLVFVIAIIGSAGYYLYFDYTQYKYTKTPSISNVEPNKFNQHIFTISPSPSPLFVASSFPTPKNTTTVKIKGNDSCIAKTQEALNLLQNKAQIHYSTVITYVGVIECADQGSGMYAWESPPRYQVGKATYEAGEIWYAGAIAHDSCHSKQYHDYLSKNNSASVPGEVWTGKEAERQCLDVQYDALTMIDADQNTLDYVKNIISSEYWNVPYGDRWW